MWTDLLEGLSEFTSDRDRMSSTLGQMGAAIAPPGSWQQGLGEAAAGMGRANIKSRTAAEAKKSHNEQLMELIKALSGAGPSAFSAAEVPGPTKMTIDGKGINLSLTPETGAGPTAEEPQAGGQATPQAQPQGQPKRGEITDYSFLGGEGGQPNLMDLIPF
jgi:hypothetical protein